MVTDVTSVLCMNGRNKPLGTVDPVSHERVKLRYRIKVCYKFRDEGKRLNNLNKQSILGKLH